MEISRQNLAIIENGDLLNSSCQCLVNPVNTVGIAGKGLALQFKKQYPSMFAMYRKNCFQGSLQIGNIMFYKQHKGDTRVICLFPTKAHWRNPSKLTHIELGLKVFVKYYKAWKIESAAFPKLGCGCGGLDWEFHVKPLMYKYLHNLPIYIEIYV